MWDPFWPLMAVIALAPVPLASNRPWAWSSLSLAVGVLMLWWAVNAVREPKAVRVPMRRYGFVAFVVCAVLAWFEVQALTATPDAWHHPLWAEGEAALNVKLAGSISLDAAATRDALMRMMCYAGVFWLTMHLARDPLRARLTVTVVIAAGSACAIYGLVVELGNLDQVLWLEKEAYKGSLTGTFINRNSFAAYLGLCLIAALALLLSRRNRPGRAPLTTRTGLVQLAESLTPQTFALALMAAVLATALALTDSRGGLIATVIGVALFILARAVGRSGGQGRSLAFGAAVALAGVIVISSSGEETLSRFTRQDIPVADRTHVHELAARAIADEPVVGHGAGTFPQVFHLYRNTAFPWLALPFDKAHNTYLEMALEAGLIAAAAFFGVLAWLTAACMRGALWRRRDSVYPALAVGAVGLFAAHSMIDFSAQMPAVAISFAAILACGFAQSWSSLEDRESESSIGV